MNTKVSYRRQVDPVGGYIRSVAQYRAIVENKPYDIAEGEVKARLDQLRENNQLKVPSIGVNYYDKQRTKKTTEVPLSRYIDSTVRNNHIMAPSLTTYMATDVERSLLAGFTAEGTVTRSKYKKEMFKREALGDANGAAVNRLLQENVKFVLNSVSGTAGSQGTILSNTTGHSTLTSITRMVTSTGVALSEKMLGGNRAYFDNNAVMFNLIYLLSLTTQLGKKTQLYHDLQAMIEKYHIHIPSTQEVIEMIKWSSCRYWVGGEPVKAIVDLIDAVDGVTKAAFVYLGDLYHFRKYNDSLMRAIMGDLCRLKTEGVAVKPLKSYREDDIIHAHILNFNMVKGKGKEYDTLFKPEEVEQLATTAASIEYNIDKYQDLLNTLCKSDHTPSNIASMGSFLRENVLLSDTDSVGLTTDNWVRWYTGATKVTDESYHVGSACIYLFTTYLVHQLAMLSANIGVEQKEIHRLGMKNEYFWNVFIVAMLKHYYAGTVTREGSVYKAPSLEKKGVHLKNSALPKDIVTQADDMMNDIIRTISEHGQVSLNEYIDRVISIERMVYERIMTGGGDDLKVLSIKSPEAYKQKEANANYQYHLFWKEVFMDKYGGPSEPPYNAVKVNITLSNKTKIDKYLSNTTNPILIKWKAWLTRAQKTDHSVIYVPQDIIGDMGIPPEIQPVVDVTSIILDICNVFYLILGTLGYHKTTGVTLTEVLALQYKE